MDSENRSLVNELAELRLKTNLATTTLSNLSDNDNNNHTNTTNTTILTTDINTTNLSNNTIIQTINNNTTHTNNNNIPTTTDIIMNSIELEIPEPPNNDFWSSSRIRQRSNNSSKGLVHYKKKRTVQDLHEVI